MPSDVLSREQIVQAALELLDADGVEGLSMRKLGTRLGSGATSLYWYVKNKDDLVNVAVDEAMGEIELPDPAQAGWREAAMITARSMRAVLLRHPWLALTIVSRPTAGPKSARFTDHNLAVFEAAGFQGYDLDWAAGGLFSIVYGLAIGEVGEANWRAGLRAAGIDEDKHIAEVMTNYLETTAEFPRLQERTTAIGDLPPEQVRDDSFEFGVRTFLDGLAARL